MESLAGRERGMDALSVAADLTGMGARALRLSDARGLLRSERTDGGIRRYSANDLDRLRRISSCRPARTSPESP
jgi:DNA-binding transcriptional MerR regulator